MKSKFVYLVTDPISANVFGLKQIPYLHKLGFEIHLICGPGVLDEKLKVYVENIYTISRLKRQISPVSDLMAIIQIFFILRRLSPTVIIYSTPKAAFVGAVSSFISRTPVRLYQIWGIRWQNLSGIKYWVVKFADLFAMRISTNITVVSKSLLEYLKNYTPNRKLAVLGMGSTIGIDTDIFYFDGSKKEISGDIVLGFAGRLAHDKGIDNLLELFKNVQYSFPNARLEIIGDIDLNDKISNDLIQKLYSHSSISWLPHLPQNKLSIQMRKWDLQIFLSNREGLGNVVLEAGACGVPTFCWDILGLKSAFPTFAQNFLIPFGNLNKLESSILKYLYSPWSLSDKSLLSNWYIQNFEQKKVLNEFANYISVIMSDNHE